MREFDTFQFKDAIPASCVTIVARAPVAQWRVAFGIGSCVRHSERRNKLRDSELRGKTNRSTRTSEESFWGCLKISANSLEAAQRFSAASDIDILDTDADIYHHGKRSASPPEALGMVWGSPQEALENPWGALGKLVGSLRALKRKRGFDGSTRSEPARTRKDRKKEEKTQWWQAPSSSTAWV